MIAIFVACMVLLGVDLSHHPLNADDTTVVLSRDAKLDEVIRQQRDRLEQLLAPYVSNDAAQLGGAASITRAELDTLKEYISNYASENYAKPESERKPPDFDALFKVPRGSFVKRLDQMGGMVRSLGHTAAFIDVQDSFYAAARSSADNIKWSETQNSAGIETLDKLTNEAESMAKQMEASGQSGKYLEDSFTGPLRPESLLLSKIDEVLNRESRESDERFKAATERLKKAREKLAMAPDQINKKRRLEAVQQLEKLLKQKNVCELPKIGDDVARHLERCIEATSKPGMLATAAVSLLDNWQQISVKMASESGNGPNEILKEISAELSGSVLANDYAVYRKYEGNNRQGWRAINFVKQAPAGFDGSLAEIGMASQKWGAQHINKDRLFNKTKYGLKKISNLRQAILKDLDKYARSAARALCLGDRLNDPNTYAVDKNRDDALSRLMACVDDYLTNNRFRDSLWTPKVNDALREVGFKANVDGKKLDIDQLNSQKLKLQENLLQKSFLAWQLKDPDSKLHDLFSGNKGMQDDDPSDAALDKELSKALDNYHNANTKVLQDLAKLCEPTDDEKDKCQQLAGTGRWQVGEKAKLSSDRCLQLIAQKKAIEMLKENTALLSRILKRRPDLALVVCTLISMDKNKSNPLAVLGDFAAELEVRAMRQAQAISTGAKTAAVLGAIGAPIATVAGITWAGYAVGVSGFGVGVMETAKLRHEYGELKDAHEKALAELARRGIGSTEQLSWQLDKISSAQGQLVLQGMISVASAAAVTTRIVAEVRHLRDLEQIARVSRVVVSQVVAGKTLLTPGREADELVERLRANAKDASLDQVGGQDSHDMSGSAGIPSR